MKVLLTLTTALLLFAIPAPAQKAVQQKAAATTLRQSLVRFGAIRDSNRGLKLVLPETIWTNSRSASLSAAAPAKLDQLGAVLANNPDYQILIESYTDSKGNEVSLKQLTQERASVLSDKLSAAGVDATRIQARGRGAANPLAPNTTIAGQRRNRRTEITLTLAAP